jgi:hypothetical protein
MSRRKESTPEEEVAYFEAQKSRFEWVTTQARFIGNTIGRQTVTPPQGYGAWLFMRAIITAGSLEKLFEPQDATIGGIKYLDHASIASLGRALIENATVLLYIGDTSIPEDEFWMRKHLIDLHDYTERTKFLTDIGRLETPPDGKMLQELKDRLLGSRAFMALPERRREHLLKGKDMFVISRHDASLALGWGDQLSRGIYKYLSAHAHSTSMAFHRTEENKIYEPNSNAAKVTAGFAIDHAHQALGISCLRMVDLFPYIEATFDPLVFSALKSEYKR